MGEESDVTDGDVGTCFTTSTDTVSWITIHMEQERYVTGVKIFTSRRRLRIRLIRDKALIVIVSIFFSCNLDVTGSRDE